MTEIQLGLTAGQESDECASAGESDGEPFADPAAGAGHQHGDSLEGVHVITLVQSDRRWAREASAAQRNPRVCLAQTACRSSLHSKYSNSTPCLMLEKPDAWDRQMRTGTRA